MTKTKAQLRAEAVERLRGLNAYVDGPESIVEKLAYGLDTDRFNYHVEIEHIIDLLTDECGPCYSCAKLAELRAENNALRGKVDELAANDGNVLQPVTHAHERVTNQGEMLHDSREKLEADVLGYWHEEFPGADKYDMLELVCGWLDRQAAITERHILTHPDERDEQIAELEAKVDELTAELERDTLPACNTCATRIDMQEKLDKIREIAS